MILLRRPGPMRLRSASVRAPSYPIDAEVQTSAFDAGLARAPIPMTEWRRIEREWI